MTDLFYNKILLVSSKTRLFKLHLFASLCLPPEVGQGHQTPRRWPWGPLLSPRLVAPQEICCPAHPGSWTSHPNPARMVSRRSDDVPTSTRLSWSEIPMPPVTPWWSEVKKKTEQTNVITANDRDVGNLTMQILTLGPICGKPEITFLFNNIEQNAEHLDRLRPKIDKNGSRQSTSE